MEKGHPFSMYALEGGSHENQCHSAYSNAFAVHYFICEMHTMEGGRVQKLGKMCVHSKWMAPIK